jgi:PhnB protein
VTPYLRVRDAAGAIEFYKQAFGATETMRLVDSHGKIMHAEVKIGQASLMLSDEFPEMGLLSPRSLGGSPVAIHLLVEDVDAVADRAVTAGAKILTPVVDHFFGERLGRFEDPCGHIWLIVTRFETPSPEEVQQRFEAHMKRSSGESA